jgi:phage shock protein C
VAKKKKFKRNSKDKIISGVLAGVANWLNIDVTVVRIIWLVLLAFTGFVPGILVYVLASILVPIK